MDLGIIAGIVMLVGWAIATFMFTMVELAMRPVLPLPGGERIVGIRAWDLRERAAANATPHDYATLRATLETMESVGAFRMAERNLILADSSGGEVFTAEMTASAFTVTGVAPLLGRVFTEADEVAGNARVLVISHELWRTRFQSSPSILGVTVRLGGESHAIVGVQTSCETGKA